MEVQKKNWNAKARLGYAVVLSRLMKDELRRAKASGYELDHQDIGLKCLEALKKMDSLGEGSVIKDELSANAFEKVGDQAQVCNRLLLGYISLLKNASDDYRTGLTKLNKSVLELLSSSKVVVFDWKNIADKGKEKKFAALSVRRNQWETAMGAAEDRIKALFNDIDRFKDEKLLAKLREKVMKMKNEYKMLIEMGEKIRADIDKCISD